MFQCYLNITNEKYKNPFFSVNASKISSLRQDYDIALVR